jgi:hypothetical protein
MASTWDRAWRGIGGGVGERHIQYTAPPAAAKAAMPITSPRDPSARCTAERLDARGKTAKISGSPLSKGPAI